MRAARAVWQWWRVLAWDVLDAARVFRGKRRFRAALAAHLLDSGAMRKAVRS